MATKTAAPTPPPADPWTNPDGPPAAGGDKPWLDRMAAADAATKAAPPQRRPAAALPEYVMTMRKPTGTHPYPVILVDGPEYSGKSTAAVELGLDPRLGPTWILAVGEEVDWLGAINPDFSIVEHNGQWWQIMAAARQLHADATAIREAGGPPPLVILDSGSKTHELLSNWAEFRARSSNFNKRKLLFDPNAEITVDPSYWNAANRRHRRLIQVLRSMPAVVVITARGKWVSAFDDATGLPIANKREYSVQANRELGSATTAWVRLAAGEPAQIVGCRLARGGIQPGHDKPLVVDTDLDRFAHLRERGGFDLSWLLFDVLKFDGSTAEVSKMVEPVAGAEPEEPAAPLTVAGAQADPDDEADEAPGRTPDEVVHPRAVG